MAETGLDRSREDNEMAIVTTNQLEQYLRVKQMPVSKITPVSGGSSNYVWRVTTTEGQSMLIKHAEPFLAAKRDVPFPLYRMDIEVHAIKTIPGLMPADETVRLPGLLDYDEENHVLRLEDVGQRSLHDCYDDPRLNVRRVGESIGRWLARLHKVTTDENVRRHFTHPVMKKMYRWNYENLAGVLEKYGFDSALGERINAKYGALLDTDDVCVCHSDMWPGNILIGDIVGNCAMPQVTVIDWEAARRGNAVTDIGHFAGDSWFLDRIRGSRGLLDAFLGAYSKERPLGQEEKERVLAQFGTHICFWPTVYVGKRSQARR
jgi:thiamine kinase-like enzyme